MKTYHKIPTVWARDPETKYKTLIEGQWATPELELLQDVEWEATEKVDGTNIRVLFDHPNAVYPLEFAGRTDNAQLHQGLLAHLRETFNQHCLREVWPIPTSPHPGVTLYGEGFGAKIQGGGKYKADGQDFVLFDVQVGDMWLERHNIDDIAEKLGIQVVPSVQWQEKDTLTGLISWYRANHAQIKSRWGDFPMEGFVMRPTVELLDRRGNRIICKIKAKDWVSS